MAEVPFYEPINLNAADRKDPYQNLPKEKLNLIEKEKDF